MEYLVKWKNYPLEEASWEPVTNLTNAQEAIEEFHLEHPDAPCRVRIMERIRNGTQPMALKKLFGWQDGRFEPDDLEQLEKAWEGWKGKDFATVWDEDDDEEFARTQTLKGGVMLRVTITSPLFLSYQVTDGLRLCKRPAGHLMDNTW